MKHTHFTKKRTNNLRVILAVIGCMVVAFGVGIGSSRVLHTIAPTNADSAQLPGDLNGNGRYDQDDLRAALEIAAGYRKATQAELMADPDQDLQITAKDALTIFSHLELR